MRLHVGCGERRLPGYQHVDLRHLHGLDAVADLVHMPFGTDSVVEVYACHMLEHIKRPAVPALLWEWSRVLKSHEGVLRLAVPDFNMIATLYLDCGVSLVRLWGYILGRQNYPENTHYTVWDYELLAYVVTECGFYDAKTWHPGDVFPRGYNDYSYSRYNGYDCSLNLMATAI